MKAFSSHGLYSAAAARCLERIDSDQGGDNKLYDRKFFHV